MTAEFGEFLFEVGCEEIPASLIPTAAERLKEILSKHFDAEGLLEGAPVECFGAPRRLVATCVKLRLRQEDATREVLGPPKSIAFDAAGNPTRAAGSFAAKQGVAVSDLSIAATPRGDYVCSRQVVAGRSAAERLSEILPRAIVEIPWPRSMYWTEITGLRFIRPIRWVLAVVGREPVSFELDGLRSGAITQGHRFIGKRAIRVRGIEEYLGKLRANFVLALPEERRKKLQGELDGLTAGAGLMVNPDEHLMEQVVYLNEYPTAIRGNFEPSYLHLPEEILITVMRDHQKYFAVRAQDGRLAPNFIAIINLDCDAKGLIQAGHERVLRARFADAKFFWETDQKCRLADYVPRLAAVTFQVKLGSYADKVQRIRDVAKYVAEQLISKASLDIQVTHVDRAAQLSKCDLITGMVREFTELQGIVGGLYAKAQEEPEDVATAIYDQYRPESMEDSIPRNLTGAVLAIADKLDTLVGCFAVGLIPTGSSDPFALRRAALGIVKVILELGLQLSLQNLVSAAADALSSHAPHLAVGSETKSQAVDFLLDRARYIFMQRDGFAADEVNAVLAAGADDLVDGGARISAVRIIRTTYDFEPLAVSFKRIRKILEKAGKDETWRLPAVDPALFKEPAEQKLHASAVRASGQCEIHKESRAYREALQEIAALRPDVDDFFEHVMVMDEQKEVRQNRLTLLWTLLNQFSTIADFSELVPGEK